MPPWEWECSLAFAQGQILPLVKCNSALAKELASGVDFPNQLRQFLHSHSPLMLWCTSCPLTLKFVAPLSTRSVKVWFIAAALSHAYDTILHKAC